MDRIIQPKGTGKTHMLLDIAKSNNGLVVCSNPDAMKQKSYAYGITGIDFISYGDFICNQKNYTDRNIYIDEIESIFKYFGNNIKGYTLSLED